MSSDLKVTNIKHENSSSNNLVLASNGNVSITNTLSAGTIGSGVTFPKTISSYSWNQWNPSDVSGTYTNAPQAGTTTDSDYTSMSNSSGTLTITFDIAGSYLVNLFYRSLHGNTYVYANFDTSAGGSASRIGLIDHTPWGPIPGHGGSISTTNSYQIDATSGQTLTILPKYRISGSGTTGQHTAGANVNVTYCGA